MQRAWLAMACCQGFLHSFSLSSREFDFQSFGNVAEGLPCRLSDKPHGVRPPAFLSVLALPRFRV